MHRVRPSAPSGPRCHAATDSDRSNIGFVSYTKSPVPATLNARWIFADRYRGAGIATGGPRDGFAGSDHVRYDVEVSAVGWRKVGR